jgi:hypothetical protein
LQLNQIPNYADANRYLEQHFIADFNCRFMVGTAQKESKLPTARHLTGATAFARHQLIVPDDSVVFESLIVQLPDSVSGFISCAAR